MITVAYLFHKNAADPAVQSGRPASILKHLLAQGVIVHPVFPLETSLSRGSTLKKALYRIVGRKYRGDREPRYLSAVASEFVRRTRAVPYDIAFSPGSEAVSRLDISRPIAFCADATFANMVDYYGEFSGLSAEYVRQGHKQESDSLSRAALAVYPSEWAARSAIDYYHTDPGKVAVIPFGANFGAQNQRDQVHQWISDRDFDTLRLLFVGSSWRRKGGALVVEAARRLVANGSSVKLDIVSKDAPQSLRSVSWITLHGVVDPGMQDTARILGELFKAAHFVFIPSRAEAYGMAFAEANAFGVPAIGTATGGIPSVVRDGVNGFTLPLSAGAQDFADLICGLMSNRGQYQFICRRSFEEFEQRLNWRTFCANFLALANQCCEGLSRRTGAPADLRR